MSDENTTPAAQTISQADFDKAVQRAQTFEAKLKDYEVKFKDINPDKYKALLEEAEIAKREQAAGDPKKVEELIAAKEKEIGERFGSKLSEQQKALQKAETELKELRVVSVAMKEAAEVFNADSLDLIESKVRSMCDWEDGKIVVKDADGKPRYSQANPRELMSVSELMSELAGKYVSCAKPTAQGGAKQGGTQSSARMSHKPFNQMSEGELRSHLQAHPEDADKIFAGKF